MFVLVPLMKQLIFQYHQIDETRYTLHGIFILINCVFLHRYEMIWFLSCKHNDLIRYTCKGETHNLFRIVLILFHSRNLPMPTMDLKYSMISDDTSRASPWAICIHATVLLHWLDVNEFCTGIYSNLVQHYFWLYLPYVF